MGYLKTQWLLCATLHVSSDSAVHVFSLAIMCAVLPWMRFLGVYCQQDLPGDIEILPRAGPNIACTGIVTSWVLQLLQVNLQKVKGLPG